MIVLSVNILVFVPQKPSAPQLYGQEEDSQQTVKEPERQQVEAEPEPVRWALIWYLLALVLTSMQETYVFLLLHV